MNPKTKLKDLKWEIPGTENPEIGRDAGIIFLIGFFGLPVLIVIVCFVIIPLADFISEGNANRIVFFLLGIGLLIFGVWRTINHFIK